MSKWEPPQLLSPAEVAKAFHVAAKTVTRWAQSGRLTTIKTPGGQRRFLKAEVDTLLRRREIGGTR